MNEDELQHFGILGMKWGRRKDKGGSSMRQNISQKSFNRTQKNRLKNVKQKKKEQNIKKQIKEVKKTRKKAMDRMVLMSDKELDDRIRRLTKEKQLKQLTEEQTSPGQKFIKTQLSNFGNRSINMATSLGFEIGKYNIKKNLGMIK